MKRCSPLRISNSLTPTLLVALCVVAGLAACKEKGGGDDPAAGGHEGHGHDAGGAQAGAEGEAHADEAKLTPEAMARYGIKTARVSKILLVPEFQASARVAFNQNAMAHVGTPVHGRAREVRVKVGDFVKKGDLVVVLDSPELGTQQSEFLTKRREAETALPGVELAKSSYERGKSFYDESRGITLTELQRREAELRAAEAFVANLRTAIAAAENRLHLLGMTQEAVEKLAATAEIDPTFLVSAPIDGQVIERHVTLGELVGPERDALIVLADTRTLWVLADVPEARLPDVFVGSRARLTVPALGGSTLEGSVTFLAPEIDAATRTAPVRIEVTDVKGLRPGMFAQAWISRGGPPPEPVLAVPQEAIQTFEGKTVVFVPTGHAPGEFRPQEVSIAPQVAGMVAVLKGLSAGDEYVATGSFLIKAEIGKSGAAHEH